MQLTENFSLKHYNTFGIHVMAKYFSAFSNTNELAEILEYKNEHKFVLGGGSNILLICRFIIFLLK